METKGKLYAKDCVGALKKLDFSDNKLDRILDLTYPSFDLTKTPVLKIKVHVINCEEDYHFELIVYNTNKKEVEKLLKDFKLNNPYSGEYAYLKMLKEYGIDATVVKYDLEI